MKKFINKNLAVILSFAIILSTLLPVMSGFIGAADSAYDSNKIAELKAAWEDLEITETLVPDKVWKTFDTVTDREYTINDSTGYTGTDIDKALLGPKYLSYTTTGTGGAADNNDYIVFKLLNSASSYKVSDIKSYSVQYNTTASNGIRVYMHFMANEGERTIYDAGFLHSPIAVGWSELASSAVCDRAVYANYQDKAFMGLGFDMTGVATTVTVGSMTAKFKAVDAATLALATSDTDAFYNAAKVFYSTAIANDTFAEDDAKFIRFANAYNALAAEAEKRAKIVELKAAWEGLEYTVEYVPTVVWQGDNTPEALNAADSSAYTGADITADKLGSKYATYSSTGTSAGDARDFVVFQPASSVEHTYSKLAGYSVQVKASVGINMRPKYMYPKTNTTDQYSYFGNDPSYYGAATFTANTWKELTLENVSNPDAVKALFSSNANFTGKTVAGIALDLGGVADVTVGSMQVKFKAVDAETLALADSDADTFIAAAITFYEDAVENNTFAESDAGFVRFKTAVSAVADEYAKKLKLTELKEAWGALTITETLVPAELWNGSNTVVQNGLNVQDSANYAGTDIDKALLGSKYVSYTTTGTGGAADNHRSCGCGNSSRRRNTLYNPC